MSRILTDERKKKQEIAIELRKKGMSLREIQKEINISPGTISRWVEDIELTDEQKKHFEEQRTKSLRGKKEKEREEARCLRRQGKSVREIAKEMNAAKGSVSYWVRDVHLNQKQKDLLMKNRSHGGMGCWTQEQRDKAANNRIQQALVKRKEYQNIGRYKIKNDASDLYKQGIMLYWAEGSKDRNSVKFCNSNVSMMKIFVKFLKIEKDVPLNKFSLHINCYLNNGLTIEEIENYWLQELELLRSSLRKHAINTEKKKKIGTTRKKKHKYGICSIQVCDTKIVQEIFGAIQEYSGFDNLEWVQ